MKTLVFVGGGNITTRMVEGLLASGYPAEKIIISNPTTTKAALKTLAERGVTITSGNLVAAKQAEVLVLSVKPLMIPNVAPDLSPVIEENNPLVISLAAAITLEDLQMLLGEEAKIVRAMPNIAAAVRKSCTTICSNRNVTAAEEEWTKTFFERVGTVKVRPTEEEALLSQDTAVKGCGPAYPYLFMEAYCKAAGKRGLTPQEALRDTLELFKGSVLLAELELAKLEDKNTPLFSELRRQVTTPNGVTASATKSMIEEGDIFGLFDRGLKAGERRSEELTDKISKEVKAGLPNQQKFPGSRSRDLLPKSHDSSSFLPQRPTSDALIPTVPRRGFFSVAKPNLAASFRTVFRKIR